MKDLYLFQANLQTCAVTLDAKIVYEFSLSGELKMWSPTRNLLRKKNISEKQICFIFIFRDYCLKHFYSDLLRISPSHH